MKAKTFEEYLETINKFNIESEIRNSIRRKLKKITHMGYTFETSNADVGIDIGTNDDSFDIQKFIEIPEIRNILFEEYEYHKKIKLEKIEKLFTRLDYCLFDNRYYMEFKKQGTNNFSPCHVLTILEDYQKKFISKSNRDSNMKYKHRNIEFNAKLNNKISC